MFKGPVGPQSGQTPRTIAEKKNEAGNFTEGPGYDATKGLPTALPGAAGQYKSQELKPVSTKPTEMLPAPFTIKQG